MTNRLALGNAEQYDNIANAVEQVRLRYCAYGAAEGQTCDCKYAGYWNDIGGEYRLYSVTSEQTGCAELRKTTRMFRAIAESFREEA